MTETLWKPHVTVAAVIERDKRFLLVEESTGNGVVFNQPAGHLEDGESLRQAVCRETREETAWAFEPAGLVGIYRWRIPDNGRTYMRFCFHGGCSDHRPEQPLDEGIIGTRWLNREQLVKGNRLRSPMVLTCIDDYLAGHRYPLALLSDL